MTTTKILRDALTELMDATPISCTPRLAAAWRSGKAALATADADQGSIADDAEFQSIVHDIYTSDGARQRREATERLTAYIDARKSAAPVAPAQAVADDLEQAYKLADSVMPYKDGNLRSPVAVRNDILNALNAAILAKREGSGT